MQWFRKKAQFGCLQSTHACRVQNDDNLVHATIRRARCRMAIPRDTTIYAYFHAIARNSRSLHRSVTLFARFNLRCANYHVSYDNPPCYSLASYHTGISANWDFAGSQDGPWKKGKNHLYGGTLERAWVLARYDAIMRYEHRRGSGEEKKGDRKLVRKRETERIECANKKKRNRTRWRREVIGGGRVVLPYWPWLDPKLRWVEMLPDPLVAPLFLPPRPPSSSPSCPSEVLPSVPRGTPRAPAGPTGSAL